LLKLLDPLLGADLLYVLAAMGHGDEVALVDRNFPAASRSRRFVPIWGADVVEVGRAVLTVLPLDTFVPAPVARMEVVGRPEEVPAVQKEFQRACEKAEARRIEVVSVAREDFYTRASDAFAVVATGERRPYGCFLLTKGVVSEPTEPV